MAVREKRTFRTSAYVPGSRRLWDLKTDSARVLWHACMLSADDLGHLEGEISDLKAIAPRSKWSLSEIKDMRDDLVRVKLIRLYKVKGRTYIELYKFEEEASWHGVTDRGATFPLPPKRASKHTTSGVLMVGKDTAPQNTSPSLSVLEESKEKSREGEREREPSRGSGDYKTFSIRYATAAGAHPGRQKKNTEQYAKLCEQFGETAVLEALDTWAVGRGGPRALRTNSWAAKDFLFKEGPELLEGLATSVEEEAEKPSPEGVRAAEKLYEQYGKT